MKGTITFTIIESNGQWGGGLILQDEHGEVQTVQSLYYKNSDKPAFIPVNTLIHGLRRAYALGFREIDVNTNLKTIVDTFNGTEVDYDTLHQFELKRWVFDTLDITFTYQLEIDQCLTPAFDAVERKKPLFS